jgi:predicted MPP superfamily phosphohydrolase
LFGKAFKIIAAVVFLITADMIFEVNFPAVREIDIAAEKLEKGKKITLLQISDFHDRTSSELAQKLVREAVRINPDAVLITGDLVDQSTEDFDNVYALISELHSICPSIFFVSGNHE